MLDHLQIKGLKYKNRAYNNKQPVEYTGALDANLSVFDCSGSYIVSGSDCRQVDCYLPLALLKRDLNFELRQTARQKPYCWQLDCSLLYRATVVGLMLPRVHHVLSADLQTHF